MVISLAVLDNGDGRSVADSRSAGAGQSRRLVRSPLIPDLMLQRSKSLSWAANHLPRCKAIGQPDVIGAGRSGGVSPTFLHAANNVRRYPGFQPRADADLGDQLGRLVVKRALPIYLPGLGQVLAYGRGLDRTARQGVAHIVKGASAL
jgi:hypothetical protein